MPLGFPSHQGLLAPLWRCWPGRFSVLALWCGALVPDVVDGIESVAHRGHFQQWLGHTLLGATVLGVPAGLLLTALVRRAARRGDASPLRWLRRAGTWTCRADNGSRAAPGLRRLSWEALSVWIGALSHVIFDLLSHEHSRLFWPFAEDPDWFGTWWRTAWFRVSVPGYDGYPIGPHFVAWLLLSIAGAVMFVRWPPRAA
jgi:hypothetical protein